MSGFRGNWTRHLWSEPEAHVFRERAIANDIDPADITVEDRATNFGENVAFVRRLLPSARGVTFVTKPNSVLRVRLTVPVQWPGIAAFVDAPPLHFPADVSNVVGVLGVMNEMVGDVQRILDYPARGFQVPHAFPADILASWNYLLSRGFRDHLPAPT